MLTALCLLLAGVPAARTLGQDVPSKPAAEEPEAPATAETPQEAPAREGPSAQVLWAQTLFREDFLPEGFVLAGSGPGLDKLGLEFMPGHFNPGLLHRNAIQSLAEKIPIDFTKIVGVYACIMESEESEADQIQYYSMQLVPGTDVEGVADSIRRSASNTYVVHRGEILAFVHATEDVPFYSQLWVLRALQSVLGVKYVVEKPDRAKEIEKVEYRSEFMPSGYWGRPISPAIADFFGTPQNPCYVPRSHMESLAAAFGVDAKQVVAAYICLILPPEPTEEDNNRFFGYIAIEFDKPEIAEQTRENAQSRLGGGDKKFIVNGSLFVAVMSEQPGEVYNVGVLHMYKAIKKAVESSAR